MMEKLLYQLQSFETELQAFLSKNIDPEDEKAKIERKMLQLQFRDIQERVTELADRFTLEN